jgi:sialate O-acetylesterase
MTKKNNRMNKTIRYFFLTAIIGLLLSANSIAIDLPAIISSDMVLQRNATVTIWGWADPGEKITISASWIGDPVNAKADANGAWKAQLKTTGSKEPQTIRINDSGEEVMLSNVLFGEVWLCSGQSNMQQPLNGYSGQPTFGGPMATAKSANPNLRLFTVHRTGSKTPAKDLEEYTAWQSASPNNVADFSAVAYFFGQQLQEILDVPVGMIHTSWGGSSVQAWISKEVITGFQEVNLDDVDIEKGTNHIPTALFNAMIHPLVPFSIKGALWYQGESNRKQPEQYKDLFPAMVQDWRNRWNMGEFPFYYVQIAPFMYGNNFPFQTIDNSAFMREAQLECLDRIPNSGIAITMDIGDDYCIHPPKKKEVADRLLFNALNQTYGMKSIDGASPVYSSHEVKDGSIILSFKNAENGVFAFDVLKDFEIAGENKVFYPAEAWIVNRKMVQVKSDRVPNPVAVRYAWRNWVTGTLYDTNLLPAPSFRTDDWEDATRFEE